jgi:hypothetical protein
MRPPRAYLRLQAGTTQHLTAEHGSALPVLADVVSSARRHVVGADGASRRGVAHAHHDRTAHPARGIGRRTFEVRTARRSLRVRGSTVRRVDRETFTAADKNERKESKMFHAIQHAPIFNV